LSIDDNGEVERIARDVREYLDAHPHAADTLEGVVKWWLMRQRYGRAEELVQMALELLQQEGKIVTAKTSDGRVIYSSATSLSGKKQGN
jgi:hypothetical protein